MYRCRDLGQAENLAAVLVNYKDSWINDFDLKKKKKQEKNLLKWKCRGLSVCIVKSYSYSFLE